MRIVDRSFLGRIQASHYIFLGAALIAALSLIRTSAHLGPMLFGDETGYIFVARLLSGSGAMAQIGDAAIYHFGYSLLFVPIHWISTDPLTVYSSGLVINALLAASVFPLLYISLRQLTPGSKSTALMIAMCVAVYPTYSLNTGVIWAENLLTPLLLIVFLSAAAFFRRPVWASGGILALSVTLAYATHPRMLVLVPLGLLAIGALRLLGVIGTRLMLGLAALQLGLFALVQTAVDFVVASLWRGPLRSSAGDYLSILWAPDRWLGVLVAGVGQLWYLTMASYALVLIGLVWILGEIRTSWKRSDHSTFLTVTFILLTTAGLFITSAVFMSSSADRADKIIYGRYNDTFVAVVVAVGLYALVGQVASFRGWRRAGVVGSVAVTVSIIVVSSWPTHEIAELPVNPLNILGIEHWNLLLGEIDFLKISLTCIGVAAVLRLGFAVPKARFATLMALAMLFAVTGAVSAKWVNRANVITNATITLPHILQTIGPPDKVAFDVGRLGYFRFYPYQFWNDSVEFVPYKSQNGEPPPTDVFVTSQDEWSQISGESRLIAAERNGRDALWTSPGEAQRELASLGYLLPAGLLDPLPASAYRSKVDVVNADQLAEIAIGGTLNLTLRITHSGVGSPWRPDQTFSRVEGGWVSVVGHWYLDGEPVDTDYFAIGALPRTVLPGESVEVPFRVTFPEGVKSVPGMYTLRLELVHQAVTWFEEAGDSVAEITIQVNDSALRAD